MSNYLKWGKSRYVRVVDILWQPERGVGYAVLLLESQPAKLRPMPPRRTGPGAGIV